IPAGVILRIRWLLKSATYKLPCASNAIWATPENWALLAGPSAKPRIPLPAIVDTKGLDWCLSFLQAAMLPATQMITSKIILFIWTVLIISNFWSKIVSQPFIFYIHEPLAYPDEPLTGLR